MDVAGLGLALVWAVFAACTLYVALGPEPRR